MQRTMERERVTRTLTFWLRPEFVLRVVSRFQKVAGFDRAIALASGAFTTLIPLTIIASSLATHLGGKGTADRIIDRYELTGGGAEAIRDVFAPPSGSDTSIGILGFLFFLVAVLSFSRAVQRLFEQTWELTPMSVRNTFNGLLWVGGISVYTALSGALHAVLGHTRVDLTPTLLGLPLSAVFLIWSGWVLSAKRISRRALLPFGILGSVVLAVYSIGAAV
jgi:membrane protein